MNSLLFIFKNQKDILGMNDRIFTYQVLNKGKRKIADNKILTKKLLEANEIPTPKLFAVIKDKEQLDELDFEALPKSFVLKPTTGYKGAGINIYYNRSKDGRWILADRKKHSINDIKEHIRNILDGQYSLDSRHAENSAFLEERVKMANSFKTYSYRGIPDIRVIVYKGVPVMAMLRLPTQESEGKANLNRGAIGVGVDMALGVTTSAVKNGRVIEFLPGTKIRLSGIKIPYWTKILRLAHRCQKTSELGFLGVDIIIDRDKGPMVVELNSRPGLGIQVANQAGLKERLLRLRKLKSVSEDRAVRLAKDLFGGEIESEIESISGREVIGLEEEIILTNKDGVEIKVPCKIDTGADSSSIDKELAKEIGYADVVEYAESIAGADVAEKEAEERRAFKKLLYGHEDVVKVTRIKTASGFDYRVKVEIPAKLKEKGFLMRASIADRSKLNFPVLIGKRDLKNFLIDTTKKG